MNRETLIHNIDNISSDVIINFFDQLMALCCLYQVWGYEDVHISRNEDTSFDITFENNEAASIVHSRSDGMPITLYGTRYLIDSNYSGGCDVHISLQIITS